MWFLYDESGNPVGFTLNNTEYYYLKNLQGDITAITDANGNIVAKYTYDEWGKILSITDGNGNDVSANASHIANINPLRYRGYYYDSETGFYYLLSRYYDPVTRRFINADGQLNTDSLLGFNMFAYCENNPVIYSDPCGTCLHHWRFWKDCEKCAASKEESNWSIKYNVPLYKQGNLNLCWAFCQIMVQDYKEKKKSWQLSAAIRAIRLACTVNGSNWNQGSWPTNSGEWVKTNNIFELYSLLRQGPIYAYYWNGHSKDAHLIVVTGVNVLKDMVYTNNPWGYRGTQSYEDFNRGFYGAPSDYDMPLYSLILIG